MPLYIRVSRTIVSPGKFERHDVFCALPLGLKQNHEGMTLFQVCELFGKLVGKLVDVSTLLGNYRMVSRSDVCCFINHG